MVAPGKPGAIPEKGRKLLIVTGIYPPRQGGPAAQSQLFADELEARGIKVAVVTYGPPPAKSEDDRVLYVGGVSEAGHLGKPSRARRIRLEIEDIFEAQQPDAVMAQTCFGPLVFWAGVAARRRRLRSWVKIANDPLLDFRYRAAPEWLSPRAAVRIVYAWLATAIILAIYSRVWVTSPGMFTRISRIYRIGSDRMLLSPNLFRLPAVPVLKPEGKGLGPQLVYSGRLQRIKGVDILLEAFSLWRRPDARLVIAGEGSESETKSLHRQSERLGVAHQVDFVGNLQPAALKNLYSSSDLLVLPSRTEAFGNVLVEAMAHGLPIIATDVGSVRWVTGEGRAAILVAPEDPEMLAKSFDKFFSDRDLRTRLARAGLRRARKFSIESGILQWIERIGPAS